MPKKKAVVAESTEKKKDLFSLLDAIYTNQTIEFFDELSDADKKTYKNSRYMLHRFISMNPNYAPVVNVIQKYTSIPERAHYQFLTEILPKGKQFNKYIKGDKDEKYKDWLVDIVSKHYHVSKAEAIQYLEIYYTHNKPALRELCGTYGVDTKTLKTAKL
jgi:hypothetical protein